VPLETLGRPRKDKAMCGIKEELLSGERMMGKQLGIADNRVPKEFAD
jgi:hypothetical protein